MDASLGGCHMIRVCIVEDQTLVRQGIQTLLDMIEDINVVAEACDGEQALQIIPEIQPDIVLLDMYLPKKNGLDVLRELKQARALPPTLILTTFDDDKVLIGGLRAGAKGYLLKDVSLEQLTGAIRALANGGTWVQSAVSQHVFENRNRTQPEFPSLESPDPLTGREVEILRLIARGHSNREIGEALSITEGTVKNYVSSILSKMGVRDRTRAVLHALEHGYI